MQATQELIDAQLAWLANTKEQLATLDTSIGELGPVLTEGEKTMLEGRRTELTELFSGTQSELDRLRMILTELSKPVCEGCPEGACTLLTVCGARELTEEQLKLVHDICAMPVSEASKHTLLKMRL
jgi:hypothetical protein